MECVQLSHGLEDVQVQNSNWRYSSNNEKKWSPSHRPRLPEKTSSPDYRLDGIWLPHLHPAVRIVAAAAHTTPRCCDVLLNQRETLMLIATALLLVEHEEEERRLATGGACNILRQRGAYSLLVVRSRAWIATCRRPSGLFICLSLLLLHFLFLSSSSQLSCLP